MDKELLKKAYEAVYGEVKQQDGFRLVFKKVQSGFLCFHWYQRNTWVDDTLERKVLFSNGKIYENNKEVGKY
jgi:hypothetical protein